MNYKYLFLSLYIYPWSTDLLTDWLTDWLTDSRWLNDSLTHSSVRIMLLKTWQKCNKTTKSQKPSYFLQWSLCEPARWDKEDSHKIILKCNSDLSFLKNPYYSAFNWHLQVLVMQKEIQYQCPYSKLFHGFRDCFFSATN